MINIDVKNNLKVPNLNFEEELSYIAQRIFIPIMQQNIEDQISIDGSPLPEIDPKTIKRKLKLGQSSKTLIATRDLIESFYSSGISSNRVVISLRYNRLDIGRYLQIDGIRTKNGKKYFRFFGVNSQMTNNAMAFMRQKINERIQNAGSK